MNLPSFISDDVGFLYRLMRHAEMTLLDRIPYEINLVFLSTTSSGIGWLNLTVFFVIFFEGPFRRFCYLSHISLLFDNVGDWLLQLHFAHSIQTNEANDNVSTLISYERSSHKWWLIEIVNLRKVEEYMRVGPAESHCRLAAKSPNCKVVQWCDRCNVTSMQELLRNST